MNRTSYGRAVGCQVRAAYFRSLALGPSVAHWKHLLSNVAWQLDDECQRALKVFNSKPFPIGHVSMTVIFDEGDIAVTFISAECDVRT